MKRIILVLSVLFLTNCNNETSIDKPPLATVNPVANTYFGKEIQDPYRYMENLQDTLVQSWLRSQAEHSRSILDRISGRQELLDKMIEYDQRTTFKNLSPFITSNDNYFYEKETPGDKASKLYFREHKDSEEVLLFDPSTYGSDKDESYTISFFRPNDDGSKLAISIMQNGLELPDVLLMDVENRTTYPEILKRAYNYYWTQDGKHLIYQRFKDGDPASTDFYTNLKILRHTPNSSQEKDFDVFSNLKHPELGITPEHWNYPMITNGSPYVFINAYKMDNQGVIFYTPYSEFNKEHIPWKTLYRSSDDIVSFRVTENELYLLSSKNSPNFQILRTSLENPDLENAELVIKENPDAKIANYLITKDGIYYTLSFNGVQQKLYFKAHSAQEPVALELPKEAGAISLQAKGFRYSDVWVGLTGWTSDNIRYHYQVDQNEFQKDNFTNSSRYPEYDDLVIEEVMVASHDGVKIPLSLVYKKGLKRNGKSPVLMWAYGAYGYSWSPEFDPDLLLWTLEGGIVATAHVRGGGELGEAWRKGGFKTTKPNTWKDLIACTEYLIDHHYTSKKKVAIHGMSAGGITIGRAMTERPDLFAVAIPKVGAMNALRFEESASGQVNISEFGTVKDSVEFLALLKMDAYHHLENGVEYPATLITAGINDTRVVVWQPAKFAARLQAVNKSDKPILLRVDYEAGHGILESKVKQHEDLADVMSFALWQTGHPRFNLE